MANDTNGQDGQNNGKEWICRPYRTLKNGKRIYAVNYGLKAFCFWGNSDYQTNNQGDNDDPPTIN